MKLDYACPYCGTISTHQARDVTAPAIANVTCPACGGSFGAKVAPAQPKRRAPAGATRTKRPRATGRTAKRDGQLAVRHLGGTVSIRDDATGDGRTIEGYVVRYGELTAPGATMEFGPSIRETFAPGSFADVIAARGDRPVPIIDRHDGTVVGSARIFDSAEGLRYEGRLLSSQAARDYAERVAPPPAGAGVNGVSLEFVIGRIRRAGDIVTHTGVRALSAIAGSYAPAYQGAVASIRDHGGNGTMEHCEHCGAELAAGAACNCADAIQARAAAAAATMGVPANRDTAAGIVPMTRDAIAALARDAATEVVRRQLEAGAAGGGTDQWADIRAYRSLGHLVQAAAQPGATTELRAFAARALADQLTTDNNAGVTTPGVVGEVRGIVSRGRRAITAFGGPRAFEETAGLDVAWPYFDGDLTALVGVQATEKTQITSVKVEIKKGNEAIQTFAGGSDIAYQLLRRSSPSYLEVYMRILLLAWGVVTDAAFVTELESGTQTVDFAEAITAVDATELKVALVDAAVQVESATGAPAEFALAGTDAFKAAAKLLNPAPVFNTPGTMNLRRLEVDVAGLPIIHVPSVTAAKLIVSNREAAGWYEDGPFEASAEDVEKLGRDVALWSLGAPARFIPAGIVEVYDVTP